MSYHLWFTAVEDSRPFYADSIVGTRAGDSYFNHGIFLLKHSPFTPSGSTELREQIHWHVGINMHAQIGDNRLEIVDDTGKIILLCNVGIVDSNPKDSPRWGVIFDDEGNIISSWEGP